VTSIRVLCCCFALGVACVLFVSSPGAQAGEQSTVPAGSDGLSPIYHVGIPPGYRDWKLISIAHEAGDLNDLRAVLGNDVAIKAYREGESQFPDGTIIVRLAWTYAPSDSNNQVFGRVQSFVPGSAPDWYLQLMVKDSKKYRATGGWGFAQFDKDGKPADESHHETCFSCHDRPTHEAAKAHDFVFTRYAP
jgi:hypothetical protein